MDLFARFGATIRRLRLRAGYSQESFADHVGMHRNYIGTVERGETNISIESIARIAKGLRIPMSTLFMELEGVETGSEQEKSMSDFSSGEVSLHARTAHLEPALNRVAEAHQALQDAAEHLQRLAITSHMSDRNPQANMHSSSHGNPSGKPIGNPPPLAPASPPPMVPSTAPPTAPSTASSTAKAQHKHPHQRNPKGDLP